MEEIFKIQKFELWDNVHKNVYASDCFKRLITKSQKPIKDFRLYRYIQFHFVQKDFEKKQFVFISPKKWDDPFEKKALMSNNIFCVCTKYVCSINEEASWSHYSKNAKTPLVRVSYIFNELIKLLNVLGIKNKVNFYFSVVDYSLDRKSITKLFTYYKRNNKSLTIDHILSLMSLKRNAFDYEKEIRIFAIPQNDNQKTRKWIDDEIMPLSLNAVSMNWNPIIGSVTLPPLPYIGDVSETMLEQTQKIVNGGIEDYLNAFFLNIHYRRPIMTKKVVNSALYR